MTVKIIQRLTFLTLLRVVERVTASHDGDSDSSAQYCFHIERSTALQNANALSATERSPSRLKRKGACNFEDVINIKEINSN